MTIQGQDFTMHAGETCRLVVAVEDGAGAPLPLAGGSAVWAMRHGGNSLQVDASIDGTDVVVDIAPGDTEGFAHGNYAHQLWVTDGDGDVAVVATGTVTLKTSLI